MRDLIDSGTRKGKPLPWDVWDLYHRWSALHPEAEGPTDPFSGYWYTYDQRGSAYRLMSAGPDGESHTTDDIVFESGTAPAKPTQKAKPRKQGD